MSICSVTWCKKYYSKSPTRLLQISPTRLLQIGQPSAEKIRLLLHPDQEGDYIQYATLSHCWGTSSTPRLTSKSLPLLREGITILDLGQTLQDAISTAQSLGIHFIWKDSLCIFQDSRDDWEHDAPLMSDVYRYALLNIAATVAANSVAGCFPVRNTYLNKPCTIRTTWVDYQNNIYYLYHDNFWQDAFTDMPLNLYRSGA